MKKFTQKSSKRILFTIGFLALIASLAWTPAVIAQDSSKLDVDATIAPNTQLTGTTTVYLPCITKEYCPGAAPSPFSIQIAGLSELNTAGLSSIEIEQMKAQQIAEYTVELQSMVQWIKDSGAGWARVYVDWSAIQGSNSTTYNWTNYDGWLNQVASAGVQIIATVSNPPPWAAVDKTSNPTCTNMIKPENVPDFNNFLAALVNRYKVSPYNIHTWEILNEPDAIDGYRCDSGVSNYGMHGADYAALLTGASSAIKAADPTAKVILGGIAYDWFYLDPANEFGDGSPDGKFNRYFIDDIMTADAANSLAAVNFHYFPDFALEWERWTVGDPPTCGNYAIRDPTGMPYYPYGLDLVAKGSHFLGRLSTCFNVNKPLWISEVGMHGIDPTSTWVAENPFALNPTPIQRYEDGQTLENQARYVFKVYARGLSLGAENITWYALKIVSSVTPGDFQGLLYDSRDGAKDNQPKPAFYAFQTLTRELTGYAFSQTLALGTAADGVEAYRFTHACNGTKIIAWTNAASTAPFVINSVNSVRLVYRPSADGIPNIDTITDGSLADGDGSVDRNITINLGVEPVIIQLMP